MSGSGSLPLRSQSRIRSIAAALGGDVVGASILCPGPGHLPRDRSLSVTLSSTHPDGFVVHSYAGDPWPDCRDHIRTLIGGRSSEYRETAKRQAKSQNATTNNSARAVRLWREGVDPRGTLAQRYLNEQRRLDLPDDIAGRVLRFHGACPWGSERRPCMLTAFRLIADDRLVAVHRTALTDRGEKIDRMMLGPVAGAAIKIDDDTDVEQSLTICEGFETGLAGRQLGFRPVWALGSAGAIGAFPVLAGINALTIFAETDKKGTNKKNVRACEQRWVAAGQEALIVVPGVAGDMNDVVMQCR
jgi:putative DNA primase/helicase